MFEHKTPSHIVKVIKEASEKFGYCEKIEKALTESYNTLSTNQDIEKQFSNMVLNVPIVVFKGNDIDKIPKFNQVFFEDCNMDNIHTSKNSCYMSMPIFDKDKSVVSKKAYICITIDKHEHITKHHLSEHLLQAFDSIHDEYIINENILIKKLGKHTTEYSIENTENGKIILKQIK